jgi:DNA repair ATPase RecN
MRLAKLRIESFRRIDELELDFTGSLGRVRDVTLLAAPNGAGKTTILDAVAAAVGSSTELPALRDGLVQSWPEITRLAREGGKPLARQTTMFDRKNEE